MKKLVLLAALLAGGSLALQNVSLGHGGTYRGPGDTVPPGGGGGGGGGGPGAPAPPAPAAPAPAGPAGAGPAAAAPGTPGASNPVQALTQTGGGPSADLTLWTFWWEFNKEPYLNLKDAIHGGATVTGDSSWFLGRGAKRQEKDNLAPDEATIRQVVVPALKKALENETNNDIVTGSLIALAKIGDQATEGGESEFERLIIPFLKDGNQEIAETAGVALGILANDASVPTLKHLLTNSSEGQKLVGSTEVHYRTRAFAAYGLSLIGGQTASEPLRMDIVKTLTEVLDSEMSRARDIKVACLIAMGLIPLDTIEPAGPRVDEDGNELPLLAYESRIGQIAYVTEFMSRESETFLIRAHSPTTMARLIDGLPDEMYTTYKDQVTERLLDQLKRGSKARNEEVQSAVLALGMIGDNDGDKTDKKIRAALIDVTKDVADIQARNFSMIALGQVGGRMGSSEGTEDGISEIQKELMTQLSRGKSTLRPWAGLGIGVMGNSLVRNEATPSADMTSALRAALIEEDSPGRVGAYAIAAGILKDEESKQHALKKLDKLRDDEARGYAAVSLGLMNAREAIEPIQRIVKESKYRPDLLKQAAIALGLLGDKDLVPDLITMLEESRSLATQASISSALGFIGDKRSIEPLVAMLHNKSLTERARGFAAVALGIVADKEPLPWNSRISVDLNYRASAETLNDQNGTGILNIL